MRATRTSCRYCAVRREETLAEVPPLNERQESRGLTAAVCASPPRSWKLRGNAMVWVVVAILGLAVIVAAVPTVGWPLMLSLGAGAILGGGLVICRRFSS
jgi:hypothetical protein